MYIIAVNPMLSHVSPTFPLAHELKNRNQEVIYIGEEKVRFWIENEGCQFVSLTSCEDSKLKKLKISHKYQEIESNYRRLHEEIFQILSKFSPNDFFIFPISRFDSFYIPAANAGLRIWAYTPSNGSIYANFSIPPSTSMLIPTPFNSLKTLSFWGRRYLRKYFSLRWYKLKNYYPYNQLKCLSEKHNYKRTFTIDGFCLQLPVICLGPSELEFKDGFPTLFAGLCITSEQETTVMDKERKLVYCSLGTMSSRYLKRDRYFKELIEIFRRHSEWDLIISLGDNNNSLTLEDDVDNIKIYQFVEQKKILQKADLAILHGGYGSVKECVYYETPMIVSPSSYDQSGNAARVLYKGIGKSNSLLKKRLIDRVFKRDVSGINGKILERQICEILSDDVYIKRIKEIKKNILEQLELQKLVDYLLSIKEI